MSELPAERLTAVLHAAQYLSNLGPDQDPWGALERALSTFFAFDLVLMVGVDGGEPRLLQPPFSRGLSADEVLRLASDEVQAVVTTGFLGSQTFAAPACAVALLPLPRDRRIAAVAIVGRGGVEPFSKEELEILLALGGLFGNVVARVETERELRDHRQHLEELVAERTVELASTNARLARESAERQQAVQALRASEGELRDADRRKTEFLAMLSHELRNPLAPIRNSLFVLDRSPPGGDKARHAQAVIARQVNHLARLVDDLLDITRISRGKIELQLQPLELCELVRRTAEDHRSLFERNDVRLELSLPPEPVRVTGDVTRLAQVVGNLLGNAAKFSGRGGVTRVSVSADANGRYALIRVADTGIGIGPETLARLFQPFVQAEMPSDRNRGGLGLGLALVKGLVELHGGEISAHSAGLGQGAQFVVRLPAAAAPAATTQPPPASAVARPRRVLIIEDNADAADSLRIVLELNGHLVEVAYNGPDGLALTRAFEPEVVLCDIGLPGMDGLEVARAIRADGARSKQIVLVALSGYAQPEDLRRAAHAGFDHHLAKPPDLEQIAQLLANPPAAPPSTESG